MSVIKCLAVRWEYLMKLLVPNLVMKLTLLLDKVKSSVIHFFVFEIRSKMEYKMD